MKSGNSVLKNTLSGSSKDPYLRMLRKSFPELNFGSSSRRRFYEVKVIQNCQIIDEKCRFHSGVLRNILEYWRDFSDDVRYVVLFYLNSNHRGRIERHYMHSPRDKWEEMIKVSLQGVFPEVDTDVVNFISSFPPYNSNKSTEKFYKIIDDRAKNLDENPKITDYQIEIDEIDGNLSEILHSMQVIYHDLARIKSGQVSVSKEEPSNAIELKRNDFSENRNDSIDNKKDFLSINVPEDFYKRKEKILDDINVTLDTARVALSAIRDINPNDPKQRDLIDNIEVFYVKLQNLKNSIYAISEKSDKNYIDSTSGEIKEIRDFFFEKVLNPMSELSLKSATAYMCFAVATAGVEMFAGVGVALPYPVALGVSGGTIVGIKFGNAVMSWVKKII